MLKKIMKYIGFGKIDIENSNEENSNEYNGPAILAISLDIGNTVKKTKKLYKCNQCNRIEELINDFDSFGFLPCLKCRKNDNRHAYFICQTKGGLKYYEDFLKKTNEDISFFPKSVISNCQKKEFFNKKSKTFCYISWNEKCYHPHYSSIGNRFEISESVIVITKFGLKFKLEEPYLPNFPEFEHLIKFLGISTDGFLPYFSNINYYAEKYGLENLQDYWTIDLSDTDLLNLNNVEYMRNHYNNLLLELKLELEKLGFIY